MKEHLKYLITDESRNSIVLEARGLTHEDLIEIVEIINQRKNPLDRLNLRGNNIDDEGAKILASLKQLRYLNIGINDISDLGLGYLLDNNSFTSLDISSNRLTNDAAVVILKSTVLTWINTSTNPKITQDCQLEISKHNDKMRLDGSAMLVFDLSRRLCALRFN